MNRGLSRGDWHHSDPIITRRTELNGKEYKITSENLNNSAVVKIDVDYKPILRDRICDEAELYITIVISFTNNRRHLSPYAYEEAKQRNIVSNIVTTLQCCHLKQ